MKLEILWKCSIFKVINCYGESELINYIISQFEDIVFKNKYKFDFCSKIFIYSENEKGLIQNCLGQKKRNNFIILNPLDVLDLNEELVYDSNDTSFLAESGNSFKDIDVWYKLFK